MFLEFLKRLWSHIFVTEPCLPMNQMLKWKYLTMENHMTDPLDWSLDIRISIDEMHNIVWF